ncbi:MAG: hypothetical protein NTV02_03110 [Candidatus Zambryskibacteria bacterium]|nr:hypothetical protein [Candidatus Zambryskibacteria bacterium]
MPKGQVVPKVVRREIMTYIPKHLTQSDEEIAREFMCPLRTILNIRRSIKCFRKNPGSRTDPYKVTRRNQKVTQNNLGGYCIEEVARMNSHDKSLRKLVEELNLPINHVRLGQILRQWKNKKG